MSTFTLKTEKGGEIEIDPEQINQAELEIDGVMYVISITKKETVV